MAKKRKGGKRKKMGAASMLNPKSAVVKIGAAAVGYFFGDTINTFLDSLIPDSLTMATAATATAPAKPATLTADNADQILMVGELGLGALLLLKGKPALVKTVAGGVLAGAGLQRALISFNIVKPSAVKGYQRVPALGGYQHVPALGKIPSQLQGVPAQLQGYRVNGYAPNGSGMGVMGSLFTNAEGGSGVSNTGSGYMN